MNDLDVFLDRVDALVSSGNQLMYDGQQIGCRFPRTCLCASNQIVSLHDDGDGLTLYRSGLIETHRFKPFEKLIAKIKFFEFQCCMIIWLYHM